MMGLFNKHQLSFTRTFWIVLASGILAIVALSLALAGISSQFQGITGWTSFMAVLILGCGILGIGWWALKKDNLPRWILVLVLVATFLRLAMGAVWYITLPEFGHGSPGEKAGYVMSDARERDQAAWQLARSDKPLFQAFVKYRKADQYGGLLFLSALVYRYLGGARHLPLQMVVVTAIFSSLAILFTWALARRAWGERVARLAAWGLAIYPEAVLLGSSQMREAFVITLVAVSFYGLLRFSQERTWFGLAWLFGGLLLALPLSPPLAALLMVMLVLVALFMGKTFFGFLNIRQGRFWLIFGGLVLLIMIGLWLSWRQFAPREGFNLLEWINWWIRKSAEWQTYLSKHASGWIQKIFRNTPGWSHLPLLIVYGVVQPFLPAALISVTEAPIWQWIAIWRAIGWIVLLPVLVYAPLRSLSRNVGWFNRGLALIVWLGILAASYRGGGDQWDNPRYRVAFAALQVALVAWAWVEQSRARDPWLRRSLVSMALILAWFLPWYLQRYFYLYWPVGDVFKTLGLGVASAVLYLVWDWARTANEAGFDQNQFRTN